MNVPNNHECESECASDHHDCECDLAKDIEKIKII